MIDLGDDIFEAGMAYVALSRARKLNNVFLLRLNPYRLYCDASAINEYNRLRKENNSSQEIVDKFNTVLFIENFSTQFGKPFNKPGNDMNEHDESIEKQSCLLTRKRANGNSKPTTI